MSGVRLSRETTDVLGAGERIRPLRDQLLVEPLDWQPSALIQVAGDERRPMRGIVRAAGPGCYPKIYNKDRSKCWDSKVFRPTQVKVGDTVELGGIEIDGYDFPQVMVDSRMHILCREEDVCFVEGQE